jgi:hypothetical protein
LAGVLAGAGPEELVRSVATAHPLAATAGVHAGELDADRLKGVTVVQAKAARHGGGADVLPAA